MCENTSFWHRNQEDLFRLISDLYHTANLKCGMGKYDLTTEKTLGIFGGS